MTKRIRFLMIGGFLGAGKTTAIARLGEHYSRQGRQIGLVTNDQAYDLVDTHTLRSRGFTVGEVPGACFCCKFDDLIETIAGLTDENIPDIVIAEPVGSCTDLYATVIQPMRQLFGDRFDLGPLIVLLKPEHGLKILRDSGGRGFSPKAEYIFLKQLEEADAIAVNKIDKMTQDQRSELLDLIAQRFPGVPVSGISARDGTEFDWLVEAADAIVDQSKRLMEVDYDTYAEGEAELGWLNCQINASSDNKFNLDDLVFRLTKDIGARLSETGFEIAHLKVLGQTLENAAVANLVSSSVEAELSLASEIITERADLLVNARIAASPEELVVVVRECAARLGNEFDLDLQINNVQSFRPARPEPTHRVSNS